MESYARYVKTLDITAFVETLRQGVSCFSGVSNSARVSALR